MKFPIPFSGARAPLFSHHVVSTSQPLAAQAGLQALAQGGNAVDAALTAAITLTVVEPTMNGIGGDAFAIIWDGQKIHGLNASGRAPGAWAPEFFAGQEKMPPIGWGSVTVPGVVSAWVSLSERFGKLPFEQLFTSAVRYARNGFPVSPVIAKQWAAARDTLSEQPGFSESFLKNGQPPAAGETWQFPAQADTLAEIAVTKGQAFYRGAITDRMVKFAQQTGGVFTHEDFAAHQADWVEPLASRYRDYTLLEIPPNGSGMAAQIALGILDILDAQQYPANSAQRIHLQIEAMRLAFADVHAHVADPRFMKFDPQALLDRGYLKSRADLIQLNKADRYGAGQPHSGGTVYLCAADASGMMVSYIQSNFKGFGSGVVAPGGIAFQNRGSGFSLVPGHPNQVAPGKRPFHTIIPAFLTKDGLPVMAFGVMGGNMQPQGHLQFVMRFVDEQLNPQACSDSPRWRIDDNGNLTVEHTMPQDVIDGLRAFGHEVAVMPADSLDFGSAQAVARLDPANHRKGYVAGSDHRRDGMAVGF
jgi:gamma-glutamyltranspeptidase/glutathione hydrolase